MATKKFEEQVLKTLADLSEAVGNGFEKVLNGQNDIRNDINRMEQFLLKDHESRLQRIEAKLGLKP